VRADARTRRHRLVQPTHGARGPFYPAVQFGFAFGGFQVEVVIADFNRVALGGRGGEAGRSQGTQRPRSV